MLENAMIGSKNLVIVNMTYERSYNTASFHQNDLLFLLSSGVIKRKKKARKEKAICCLDEKIIG